MIKKFLIKIKSVFRRVKPYKSTYKLMVILLLIMLALTFSLYLREKNKVKNLTNVGIEEIVNVVGELIILPKDSSPKIATVDNVDKLKEKEPDFYKDANNGDKLLIYFDRVILYNPQRNIIVNVVPIIPDLNTEKIEKR